MTGNAPDCESGEHGSRPCLLTNHKGQVMASREVNCEYCRVVVFEVDRWCGGCGAPRKAFPDERPVIYEREPTRSYEMSSAEPSWYSVCSTAISFSCDTGSTMNFNTLTLADSG